MDHPSAHPFAQRDGDDWLIRIKAVPGASRDAISGLLGDRLKVRIAAPPEGGKANRAVCGLLANALGLGKKDVAIESGHAGAEKTVRITGADEAAIAQLTASR